MLPELGGCYAKKRCTDCEFAEADTVQVRELAHIVDHKAHGKVFWRNIPVVSSRSMLNLCNYRVVSTFT